MFKINTPITAIMTRTIKNVLGLLLLFVPMSASAQINMNNDQYDQTNSNGIANNRNRNIADSLGTDKEIPRGIKVWTIDSRFGDQREAAVDTVSHMFMNTNFTTGLRGEYNRLVTSVHHVLIVYSLIVRRPSNSSLRSHTITY